jgi:hypothetical protein
LLPGLFAIDGEGALALSLSTPAAPEPRFAAG